MGCGDCVLRGGLGREGKTGEGASCTCIVDGGRGGKGDGGEGRCWDIRGCGRKGCGCKRVGRRRDLSYGESVGGNSGCEMGSIRGKRESCDGTLCKLFHDGVASYFMEGGRSFSA